MNKLGLSRRSVARMWQYAASIVANLFHRVWYELGIWHDVEWHGFSVLKNPLDMWMYQEIVHETRPDLIIETGTFAGGSALYFAHLLDSQGAGFVVSVDLDAQDGRPQHPRLTYLQGDSVSDEIVGHLTELAANSERVMVILDSDHSRQHVEAELARLSPLVTPGCYLVVEDTNINGNPVHRHFGPGPMEAVQSFLASGSKFRRDSRRERFLFTFNPSGWLQCIRDERT